MTRGHSEDLLSRQIIKEACAIQPLNDPNISKENLLELALDAIAKRENNNFLFIDDAEEGLDASNALLPYFEKFIERFIKRGINTRIIIATSRRPDYSVQIANSAGIFRLDVIEDTYIEHYIERLLEDGNTPFDRIEKTVIEDAVEVIAGYPLAAKIVASRIKFGEHTFSMQSMQRIQLGLAQHVLSSINQEQLRDIHQLILQTLAFISASFRFLGVAPAPTHSPIWNGCSPHCFGFWRRRYSQAQMSVAAR